MQRNNRGLPVWLVGVAKTVGFAIRTDRTFYRDGYATFDHTPRRGQVLSTRHPDLLCEDHPQVTYEVDQFLGGRSGARSLRYYSSGNEQTAAMLVSAGHSVFSARILSQLRLRISRASRQYTNELLLNS